MTPPDIAKLSLRGIGVVIALAIITALATALAVQTIRLDGLKLWPFEITGWKPRAERLQGDLARVTAAQALADEAARMAKRKAEADYAALKERTDDDVQENLGDGLVAAADFISRGGVSGGMWAKAGNCPSGGAIAAAGGGRAGHPAGAGDVSQLDAAVPAPAPDPATLRQVVGVFADDVRVCTVNTAKAQAAHDWAVGVDAMNRQNQIAEPTTPGMPR